MVIAEMPEQEFSLTYGGPALEEGRMEVRDLAPALLALGDLFTEAAQVLDPDAPAPSLEIKATDRGSFDVHMILSQAEWVRLFNSPEMGAVRNMVELVIGGGMIGTGLFKLIQFLKNKLIQRQERADPATVTLTLDDGTTLQVPAPVLSLYQSISIRRRSRDVMAPLQRDGIDRLEFRSSEDVLIVALDKSDAAGFELPELPTVELLDRELELNLTIAAAVFVEGNKWRLSDGEVTYYATIQDRRFLDRVERGEEAFRKGDILRCRMRVQQHQAGTGELQTSYTVVEVMEHVPQPRTIPLPLDEGTTDT